MTLNGKPWIELRRRALAGVAAAGLLLTACVSDSAEVAPGTDATDNLAAPMPVGWSLTGNYLAGRHAHLERRLDIAADRLLEALSKDPDNIDLMRRTFSVNAAEGRFPLAAELARKLVAKDATDPLAAYAVAADDMRAGDYKAAADRLAALSKGGLNQLIVPLLQTWALAGQNRWDEALKTLDGFNGEKGLAPLRHLHAALLNDLAGRMEAAEKEYRTVAAGQSELTLRFTELMGGFLERTGRTAEAKELYAKYQTQSGAGRHLGAVISSLKEGGKPRRDIDTAAVGAAESLFSIANLLRQQGVREMALIFVRLALHLRPDYPVAQLLVGTLLEGDDRLEDANKVYRAVNPKSPFSWTARLRLATNLDGLDKTDEAVAVLRAMAAEDPKDPDPYVDLGDVLRSRERYAEAAEAYDRAVERLGPLETRHWGLLYARGIALERSRQWPRAEQDFLKALEFRPDQPQVLNYLGYTWVEQGRNLDQAQEMLRKAVRLKPHDGYIIDSLGWVYFRLGKYEAAVRELERAVELRPADPTINDHLGDAYWKVGRHQEARFQWRRSLGLGPEPEPRRETERKLKEGLAEDAPTPPAKDKNG
jgi:tetratricopeptide (TPR) repeat protein